MRRFLFNKGRTSSLLWCVPQTGVLHCGHTCHFTCHTCGCAGSLPEALVRHAAVHGAVTALRQALVGLVLGPNEVQHTQGAEGAEGEGGSRGERQQQQQQQQQQLQGEPVGQTSKAATPFSPSPPSDSCAGHAIPCPSSVPSTSLESAAECKHNPQTAASPPPKAMLPSASPSTAAPTAELAVLGCVTLGGQMLKCKEALVAGPRVLS